MTDREALSTELNPLRIDVSKHLVEHHHRLLREIGATHLQIKVDIETRPARCPVALRLACDGLLTGAVARLFETAGGRCSQATWLSRKSRSR